MRESVCVFSSLPETLCCAAAATAVAGCLGSLVAAALVTSRRHCQLRVMGPTERKQTTETLHPVAPPLTSPLEDCRPIKDKLTDAHVRNTVSPHPRVIFFFLPFTYLVECLEEQDVSAGLLQSAALHVCFWVNHSGLRVLVLLVWVEGLRTHCVSEGWGGV